MKLKIIVRDFVDRGGDGRTILKWISEERIVRTETEILWHRRIRLTFMVPELVILCTQEWPANSSTRKEQWPKHTLWHSAVQIRPDVCRTHLQGCQRFLAKSNSPHFIKPDGSFLRSQEPATCPYPEPDPVHSYPSETVCNKQTSCLFAVRIRQPLYQPTAEDQTSSAACEWLFNIFTATLRVWTLSSFIHNLWTHHAVVARTHLHGHHTLLW
jgi:hypothetical protein